MRRPLLWLVLALIFAPPDVHAACSPENTAKPPHWGLPDLMDGLRQVRAGSARFVERKYLQMMTAPLQTEGMLRYAAPDLLEKQTLLPRPGLLRIAGDQLTIEQADAPRRELSLRDYPAVGALVASLRATMAGDLAALNRFYVPSLLGNVACWRLDLVPGDPQLQGLVTAIRISGSWATLERVETQESDGDRTELVIDSIIR